MRPLPNNEPNTAASVMYEWRCETAEGRIFIPSASSMESAIRHMTEKGHKLTFIMELSEYEQMIAYEQQRMNQEIREHIEGGPNAA